MRFGLAALAAGIILGSASGLAASAQAPSAAAAPGAYRTLPEVRLWPNGAPPLANWAGRLPAAPAESRAPTPAGGANIYNVTDPTFTAFIPDTARNTRTAVIVVPGGGFRQVSIDSEGNEVAKWLAERGIAAFVLKYRLVQQPGPTFTMMARMQEPGLNMKTSGEPGVADGIEALRQVRARAAEYGIDPAKVGVIGFSAGAHIASYMTLNADLAARPGFSGLIYGAPLAGLLNAPAIDFPPIPASTGPDHLPQMFMAMAQDDPLVATETRAFYDAVFKAGYRPELHLFVNGGHGFGMNPTRSSSRHFIDEFYWWMETLGWTRKPGDPDMAMPPRAPRPAAAAPAGPPTGAPAGATAPAR
jgi:acetyl esterase/lipase